MNINHELEIFVLNYLLHAVTVESMTDDGHCFVADSNDTIQKVEEKWLLTDDDDAQREIQVTFPK